MKLSFFVLAVLCAVSAANVAGPRQAAALVLDDLLSSDISGRTVYYHPQAVYAGQGIESWHETVMSPFPGYFVLVDDMALANWEHSCRWVFVGFDGTMSVVEMQTPPDCLDRLEVFSTSLPEGTPADGESLLDWFVPNPQTPANDPENTYAWIISGGANSSNNHIRYYGDVQFLYLTLTQDYGYTNDHIVICFADGTNPAVDNSDGQNSNPDLDDDGDTDIDFDATTAGVNSGYAAIHALVGADDHLLIFTTDHGGSGKGLTDVAPEAILNLWNATWDDDTYDGLIDAIPAASMHVAMEQCYSGGFLLETVPTTGGQPRTFASAANGYESSWAGNTFPQYDEWSYWWTGAMHGSVPAGGSYPGGALPGDPDLNGDGYVSYGEAADRALAWDAYAVSGQEHPQYDDDPTSCGDNYYMGGVIGTGIGDSEGPAVSGVALSCSDNPFTGSAVISIELQAGTTAELEVLDLAGRRVATLASGEMGAGQHEVSWAADVPAGVYIVRFRSSGIDASMRVVKF